MPHLLKVCSVQIAGFGAVPVAASGSTYKPSGKKREHVAGCKASDGGFPVVPTPAELDLTMTAKKALNLQGFGEMEDKTITIKTTNGVTHVMNKAWCEEQPSLGDDGKVKAKFVSNESTGM